MWAAVVTAVNVGTLALDLHVRSVRHAGRAAVLVPRRRAARCDGPPAAQVTALADRRRRLHAARRDGCRQPRAGASSRAARRRSAPRHASSLARSGAAAGVTVHHVWRPFGRHLLGSPLLARTAQRVWRRLRGRGAAPSSTAATARSPTPTGSTTCTPRSRRRRPVSRVARARSWRSRTSATSPPNGARCAARAW